MRAIHPIIPLLVKGQSQAEAAFAAPDRGDGARVEARSRRPWMLRPIRSARKARFTVRQWPAAR
jgi:hypothetical protein